MNWDICMDYSRIRVLYTDGGVWRKNPSLVGGGWAWTGVDPNTDEQIVCRSGVLTVGMRGLEEGVSNNHTELFAACKALHAMPDGWDGTLYTDSAVTQFRLHAARSRDHHKTRKGIPQHWWDAIRTMHERLGNFKIVLLKGHPSKKALRENHKINGLPISKYNVWCDHECTRIMEQHFGEHEPIQAK